MVLEGELMALSFLQENFTEEEEERKQQLLTSCFSYMFLISNSSCTFALQ